ncbi:glycoside hydrolase family 3 C-terminal domain-containing protein [Paenibacillus sp. JNUCC31]|uniref:beta-glucosidase n=1 Tax=Paenibacillus sp. JNUCC-31 TaxID=2777983 RepID=UPI00177B2B4E|nr:glycoside hydrolase family 3 C-terminal domain-containing protein [Paenibacillus sp. JNUCC-31]QOS79408.1 glycoside hydrolase family 3 C-terminal domain-containing protein [Paenibacillus sp. JNUCC-31]
MYKDLDNLISEMTLEEKAGLCSGQDFWTTKAIERLGIPSIWLADGPHGLRKQSGEVDHLGVNGSVPATCFPSAVGLASSWNRDLIHRVGEALGLESQAEGVSILLGPGANIKRSPLCGRNFEYFSEDPYLTGEMAAAHISGVQSQGVGTSLKHFAVNNQEHRRMTTDAVVDERTLREIYLTGFEMAVKKAQPWTVMSAYNQLNGTYCSENEALLSKILNEEWGHEGLVVSDWGAVNDAVNSLAAGMHLEMPTSNGYGQKSIVDAVLNGKLSQETLDHTVKQLLTVIFKASDNKKLNVVIDQEAHHTLARETARETMVLLKNEKQLLPLSKQSRIAVIGAMAEQIRYQGGGSSHINPTKMDSPLKEIVKSAGDGAKILYAKGYDQCSDDNDEMLLNEAVEIAEQSDSAVLFLGLPDTYESEGYDRTHLNLPENQIELIERVASVQSNIVVVLSNGSPVVMPWIRHVKSVLEAYLGGQAAGGAIADLLFGDANPSGKLAETFPMTLKQNPSHPYFPGEGDRVEYREGIFVGYRYYDAKDIEPLFPFGYGLSYTNFEYSDLNIDKRILTDQESVQVSLKVKNTGKRHGKEIIQLYVKANAFKVIRPEKELKGFVKVALEPDEEQIISFTLDKRSFAYYDMDLKDWNADSGEYEIGIGSSSRNVPLTANLFIESTTTTVPVIHRNTTMGDLMANPKTAPVFAQMEGLAQKSEPQSDEVSSTMLAALAKYMPLRSLLAFGVITDEALELLLQQLNSAVKPTEKIIK